MFAFRFKGKGNFKKRGFGNFLRRNDIGYGRGSFGDGSGFVENNDFGPSGFFKRSGGFIKDSVFCADTASDHYRNRGCKTESAGAAYYKNGNSPCNCETDRFAKEEPDCRGYCRNGYYRRNKNSGNLIGGFRNGRFCCGSFLHHFYNFGKGGVFADPCCFTFYKSALVKGCGGNERTDRFINRNAFTGQSGFVNGAFALKNGSVNGNAFAGTNNKNFAFANFLDSNGNFFAVSDHRCGFGRKVHKRAKGGSCFSFGTRFKHFSDGYKRKDHRGGFKIEFVEIMVGAGHVSGDCFFGHHIKRIDAVNKGSAGTESNKGIHIRCFMEKAFEAVYEKFLVDHHYDSGKKKLGKTDCNAVLCKKFRKRPAPHGVTHGNIHQSRKKTERSNKAFFKNGGLLIFKGFGLVLFLSFFFGFKRSAIACFLNCGNYFFRFCGAFNAH